VPDAQVWARNPSDKGEKLRRHEMPIYEKESIKHVPKSPGCGRGYPFCPGQARPMGKRLNLGYDFDRKIWYCEPFQKILDTRQSEVLLKDPLF
jgi:hypothetical protein